MTNELEMVDGRYRYEDALTVATDVMEQLRPYCIRIEIAGSIRRKQALVGDIDIIAIPKPYTTGTVDSGIALVVNKWLKVKGEMQHGKTKYTQRVLPEGISLDLFFAEEDNWGYIFALRTGSFDFNKKVLLSGLKSRGFRCKDGYVFRDGEKLEAREEINLFRMAGVLYKEPAARNL